MKNNFPTNRTKLKHYPNLEKCFSKDLNKEFSSKQIFRLFDNLRTDRIKILIEFFEKLLSKDEFREFIIQKLNTTDYITFLNNIKEILLLDFLLNKGLNVHTFDNNKDKKSVPEYYAHNSTTEMLIELYSPIELYGFENFSNELRTAMCYFPNNLGFNCILKVKFNYVENESVKRQTIPFELNYKYSNDKLRHKEIDNIIGNLLQNSDSEQKEQIFHLTNDIYISASIKFWGNCNDRQVIFSTPSYDSKRDFVSIKKYSKGFYKKLLHKINSGQLSKTKYSSAQKILLVDFSHSMGSEVLVEGMGKDYFSKAFYENLSQRLKEDVSTKDVDLIFPVICGMGDNFMIGKCLFNSQNTKVPDVFNAN